jgi:sporulation protein YlmC with PRC-barrel domain
MELIGDILDKQVLDRDGIRMGKVDGVVIRLAEDGRPRLAAIEFGPVVLAYRIGPRTGGWMSRLCRRLGGARHGEPYRIPWEKVTDLGIDLEVDVSIEDTPQYERQEWLRRHLLRWIPGQ